MGNGGTAGRSPRCPPGGRWRCGSARRGPGCCRAEPVAGGGVGDTMGAVDSCTGRCTEAVGRRLWSPGDAAVVLRVDPRRVRRWVRHLGLGAGGRRGTLLSLDGLLELDRLLRVGTAPRGEGWRRLAEASVGAARICGGPRVAAVDPDPGQRAGLDRLERSVGLDGRWSWSRTRPRGIVQVCGTCRVAVRWWPVTGSPVTVDPAVRFGRPQIRGVTVERIVEAVEAGEDPGVLYDTWGLELSDVVAALRFSGRDPARWLHTG